MLLIIEFFTTNAHPPDLPGGVAGHQGVVGGVLRHYGTGADEGVAADGMAADDCAVGPQSGALFHEGWADLVHLGDLCPWVVDVRKHHGWAAEDTVFEGDTLIDGDVVLNFAFVADDGVWAYYDVLADVAVLADFGAGQDVREVPYFGALADLICFIHNCSWMDKNVDKW